MIETVFGHGCKDFDSFLAAMRAVGVEVKRGKHLAFKISSGKRFIRCDSLGDDYTDAAIMERTSGMLSAENKKRYPEYKQAREKMIELLTAKNNVERILGVTEKEKNRDRQQGAR